MTLHKYHSFTCVTCLIYMLHIYIHTHLIAIAKVAQLPDDATHIYISIHMYHSCLPTHISFIHIYIHSYTYVFIHTYIYSYTYISFTHIDDSCPTTHISFTPDDSTYISLLHMCDMPHSYRVARSRRMPYLIGHFPQKIPRISGSFAKNDMQLEGILWVFATLYAPHSI